MRSPQLLAVGPIYSAKCKIGVHKSNFQCITATWSRLSLFQRITTLNKMTFGIFQYSQFNSCLALFTPRLMTGTLYVPSSNHLRHVKYALLLCRFNRMRRDRSSADVFEARSEELKIRFPTRGLLCYSGLCLHESLRERVWRRKCSQWASQIKIICAYLLFTFAWSNQIHIIDSLAHFALRRERGRYFPNPTLCLYARTKTLKGFLDLCDLNRFSKSHKSPAQSYFQHKGFEVLHSELAFGWKCITFATNAQASPGVRADHTLLWTTQMAAYGIRRCEDCNVVPLL